jgi:hypothetical protein
VVAEIAFLSYVVLPIKGDGLVWTGIQAGLTSRAHFFIQYNNTIRPLGNSPFWADRQASRIIAMAAYPGPKNDVQLPVHYSWTIFPYGYEFNTIRRTIFLFTSHLTGLAPPTVVFIDFQV